MRNPVSDGLKFSGYRNVSGRLWVAWLFLIGVLLLCATLANAQDDAALLAKEPIPDLGAIATPDLNALFGPLPVAVPTPIPAALEGPVLAAKAPVGVPASPGVPVPPPADALSPSCPHDTEVDASACIQAAVSQGNVVLPQGTYIAHGIWLPSNHYLGGINNLVVLHNPLVTRNATDSTIMISGANNAVVTNLTFVNAGDPIKAVGRLHIAGEFTSAIDMQNGSSNNHIIANRFQGCQGDTCIVLYGGHISDADNSNVIAGNTFAACSSYAVAIVDGNDNYVGKNWLRDCSLGSEMDAGCTQTNSGNQYVDNTIQNVNGTSLYLGDQVFSPTQMTAPSITGGAALYGCGHYYNTVANNTFIGEVRVIPMR
jgi:hypothetical protein